MKLSKISTRYLKSSFVIEFVVSLVAGLSAFFWAFLFSSELNMLDSRINFRNSINNYYLDNYEPDRRILLVYLDESTVKNLNAKTGSDITARKYIASIIDLLQMGGPSVIALDYFLEENDPDKGGDEVLLKSIEGASGNGVSIVGGYALKPALSSGRIESDSGNLKVRRSYFRAVETDTFKKYMEVLPATGFLNLWSQKSRIDNGDSVDIVRFHIPVFEGAVSFPYAAYNEYCEKTVGIDSCVEFTGSLYINFRDNNPENLIETLDSKVLEIFIENPGMISGEFLENFRDRIILIGNANAGNDIHPVPINSEPGVFGVLIHAVVLLNLLNNDFIKECPEAFSWLILAIAFIAAFLLSRKNGLTKITIYNFILILVYIMVSFAVFYFWSLWIPVISVFAVVFSTALMLIVVRIAFSEKDNIDAKDFLADYIPEQILLNLNSRIEESIFTPFMDRVYVIAGWSKNLPYSENYRISDIKQFINDYNSTIQNIIFNNDGCFNVLPQNGFMGFWPLSFYEDDPYEKVIEAAEFIRDSLESINFRAGRKFGSSDSIFMDIVILEDRAFVGSFASGSNRFYSIISDSISEILQIPWMFSSDEKNSIILYEEIKNRLPISRKVVKVNRRIADRDIYELD